MRMSCCCRLLAGAVFVAFVFVPIGVLSQGGGWTPKGSMPFERGEIAVATVNEKIYVISGSSRGVEANAFNQEFDPATGMWRERSLMPSVASHAGAAVLNGKIFIVGGFVANVHVGAVNRVFEYTRQPIGGVPSRRSPLHAALLVLSRSTEKFTPSGDATLSATPSPRTKFTIPRRTAGAWRRRCRSRAIISAPSLRAGGSRLRRANECNRGQYRPARCVRPRHEHLELGGAAHHTAQRGRCVFRRWPDYLCRRRVQGSAGKRHVHRGRGLRSANRPVDLFATAAARPTRGRRRRSGTAGISVRRQRGLRREQAVERRADVPDAEVTRATETRQIFLPLCDLGPPYLGRKTWTLRERPGTILVPVHYRIGGHVGERLDRERRIEAAH